MNTISELETLLDMDMTPAPPPPSPPLPSTPNQQINKNPNKAITVINITERLMALNSSPALKEKKIITLMGSIYQERKRIVTLLKEQNANFSVFSEFEYSQRFYNIVTTKREEGFTLSNVLRNIAEAFFYIFQIKADELTSQIIFRINYLDRSSLVQNNDITLNVAQLFYSILNFVFYDVPSFVDENFILDTLESDEILLKPETKSIELKVKDHSHYLIMSNIHQVFNECCGADLWFFHLEKELVSPVYKEVIIADISLEAITYLRSNYTFSIMVQTLSGEKMKEVVEMKELYDITKSQKIPKSYIDIIIETKLLENTNEQTKFRKLFEKLWLNVINVQEDFMKENLLSLIEKYTTKYSFFSNATKQEEKKEKEEKTIHFLYMEFHLRKLLSYTSGTNIPILFNFNDIFDYFKGKDYHFCPQCFLLYNTISIISKDVSICVSCDLK